jgi:hypothetical protein
MGTAPTAGSAVDSARRKKCQWWETGVYCDRVGEEARLVGKNLTPALPVWPGRDKKRWR